MADMRVDLFGIQCNTDVPDVNGCVWNVAGIDGWGSPEVASIRQRPSGRFGTVLLDEAYGERVLGISGWVDAPDQEMAWVALEQLAVMPGVGASGTVTVHQANGARSVLVRQAEQPRTPEDIVGRSVDFLLTVVALQPYKTGAAKTVSVAAGASVTLTNDGTATAYLSATATGSGTVKLRQDVSGQVLRSRASVSSGTVFDSGLRQVRSSGGVVLAGVVDNPSEWLSIPRLASTSVTNQGTAPLSVTFYDSYA
jgi:hypothetical protein